MRHAIAVAVLALASAAVAQVKLEAAEPQTPQLSNAKLDSVAVGSGLQARVTEFEKQGGPMWVGYSIAVTPKPRTMCCFDSWEMFQNARGCCLGCRLERSGGNFFDGTDSKCSYAEPSPVAFVMFRISGGDIVRLRTYSRDCALDAGGMPVHWITDVPAVQSLAWLEQLARAEVKQEGGGHRQIASQAMHAIAVHNDARATDILERFIAEAREQHVREEAAIFLADERGPEGVESLYKLLKREPDAHFRSEAIVGFMEANTNTATKHLVDFARNDPDPEVRRNALVFMGEMGSQKMSKEISDALENDPDTRVKKAALLAFEDMPNGEGVDKLIEIAKMNKNAAVRKDAVRMLGEVGDARAVDFLASLLLSDSPKP
jgi:HEAT repeat protein